jgi:diguanylate cyclase (GGDEF)-like protein
LLHVAGDVALKSVANVVSKSLRAGDVVSRWGGEEFAVMLFANSDLALDVANRIRTNVAAECTNLVDPKIETAITISLGVSSINSYDTGPESLLKRADAALYRSKNSGRNKVTFL